MEVISNASPSIPREVAVPVELKRPANVLPLLFLLLHAPLALLINAYPELSRIHAYSPLAIGIIACIAGRLDIAAAAAAYIAGGEVLWRMTEAPIFWEYAKYAALVIFVLGIIRSGLRNSGLPFLYIAFLIPSAVLTMEGMPFSQARQELSFNLSGPLALFGSACFFSGLSFTKNQIRRIFIAALAPIIGIAAIAIHSTLTASSIYFGADSNFILVGGYGPNQVSAMLGLGALFTVLFVTAVKSNTFLKVTLLAIGTALISQCLLTFSRGGVYMAASSILIAAFVLLRDPRKVFTLLFGVLVIGGTLIFWVLPRLNEFTGGTLVERYKDKGLTGRAEIIQDDLRIWAEHPILGVGPGKAKAYRYLSHQRIAAHTEYTRMLAEHGMFGLCAILILFLIAIRNYRMADSFEWKAVAASVLFWSLVYMVINAMRLLAPSFLIGLSSAQIMEDDDYFSAEPVSDEVDA